MRGPTEYNGEGLLRAGTTSSLPVALPLAESSARGVCLRFPLLLFSSKNFVPALDSGGPGGRGGGRGGALGARATSWTPGSRPRWRPGSARCAPPPPRFSPSFSPLSRAPPLLGPLLRPPYRCARGGARQRFTLLTGAADRWLLWGTHRAGRRGGGLQLEEFKRRKAASAAARAGGEPAGSSESAEPAAPAPSAPGLALGAVSTEEALRAQLRAAEARAAGLQDEVSEKNARVQVLEAAVAAAAVAPPPKGQGQQGFEEIRKQAADAAHAYEKVKGDMELLETEARELREENAKLQSQGENQAALAATDAKLLEGLQGEVRGHEKKAKKLEKELKQAQEVAQEAQGHADGLRHAEDEGREAKERADKELALAQEALELVHEEVSMLKQAVEQEKAKAATSEASTARKTAELQRELNEAQSALAVQESQVSQTENIEAELASARELSTALEEKLEVKEREAAEAASDSAHKSGADQQRIATLEARLGELDEEAKAARGRTADLQRELEQGTGALDKLQLDHEDLQAQFSALNSRAETAASCLVDVQGLLDRSGEDRQALESALVVKEEAWNTARVGLEERVAQLEGSLSEAAERATSHGATAEELDAQTARAEGLERSLEAHAAEKEELMGTASRLKSQLAELQERNGAVESLKGELAGKAEIVEQLERDLESLKGQMAGKDAMFEGLQAELVSLRKDNEDRKATQTAETGVAQERAAALEAQLERLTGELSQSSDCAQRLESALAEERKAFSRQEKELDQSQGHVQDLTSQLERLAGELSSQSEQMERLKEERKGAAAVRKELKQKEQQLGHMGDLEDQVRQLTSELSKKSSDCNGLQKTLAELEESREGAQEEIALLQGNLVRADAECKDLRGEVELLESSCTSLEAQVGNLGAQLQERESESASKLAQLGPEVEALRREAAARRDSCEALEAELEKARQSSIEEADTMAENMAARVSALSEAHSLLEKFRLENDALKASQSEASQRADEVRLTLKEAERTAEERDRLRDQLAQQVVATEQVLEEKEEYLADLEGLIEQQESLEASKAELERRLGAEAERAARAEASAAAGLTERDEARQQLVELRPAVEVSKAHEQHLNALSQELDGARNELLDAQARIAAAQSETDRTRQEGLRLEQQVQQLQDQRGDFEVASQRHQAAEEAANLAQREAGTMRDQARAAENRLLRALPELDTTLEFLADHLSAEGGAQVALPAGAGALEKFEAVAGSLPALRAAFRVVEGESQSLKQELRMAEARAQILQPPPLQPIPDHTMSNKKDEDSFDIEAAMLTGGAGGFQPIAGLMRGAPRALQLPPCVSLAEMADSWTVIMHTKPQLRLALIVYLALLHALFLGAVVF